MDRRKRELEEKKQDILAAIKLLEDQLRTKILRKKAIKLQVIDNLISSLRTLDRAEYCNKSQELPAFRYPRGAQAAEIPRHF